MGNLTYSIDQFSYRPALIDIGTIYHYIKSNIDGSYPAQIFIYVRERDQLDVLKFEQHGMDAALVQAHIDWQTFSADQLASWVLTADGQRRAQASLNSSFADKTFTISWQGRSDVIQVGHYPVHIYNFDLIGFNYILRHWQNPEGEVTIGILQPNFDPNPETMMKYEGTIIIQYQGNEERNLQPCRKYTIGGEGLKGCTGVMWVHREKGYMEDIEIPIADNPDWDTFKFKLVSSASMSLQQWEDFTAAEIRKLKTR